MTPDQRSIGTRRRRQQSFASIKISSFKVGRRPSVRGGLAHMRYAFYFEKYILAFFMKSFGAYMGMDLTVGRRQHSFLARRSERKLRDGVANGDVARGVMFGNGVRADIKNGGVGSPPNSVTTHTLDLTIIRPPNTMIQGRPMNYGVSPRRQFLQYFCNTFIVSR